MLFSVCLADFSALLTLSWVPIVEPVWIVEGFYILGGNPVSQPIVSQYWRELQPVMPMTENRPLDFIVTWSTSWFVVF